VPFLVKAQVSHSRSYSLYFVLTLGHQRLTLPLLLFAQADFPATAMEQQQQRDRAGRSSMAELTAAAAGQSWQEQHHGRAGRSSTTAELAGAAAWQSWQEQQGRAGSSSRAELAAAAGQSWQEQQHGRAGSSSRAELAGAAGQSW